MQAPKPQPKPRRHPSVQAVLVYSGLLTGVLYSLGFHLSGDSPLRLGGARPQALEVAENLRTKNAGQIDHASEQQNILLHFQIPEEMWAKNDSYFVGIYFRTAYQMYPRRVFVGSDNRVINSAADLRAADQLPNIDWLQKHDVAAVFSYLPGDLFGPKSVVYRLP